MKKKQVNYNKYQLITIGAIILACLFNPMTVEILDEYFKWAYTIISIASTIWIMGYLLKKVLTPEKTNYKVKGGSKVKPSEYLEY